MCDNTSVNINKNRVFSVLEGKKMLTISHQNKCSALSIIKKMKKNINFSNNTLCEVIESSYNQPFAYIYSYAHMCISRLGPMKCIHMIILDHLG